MTQSKKYLGYVGLLLANFMAMLLICGVGNLGFAAAGEFNSMHMVSLIFALETCCRCAACPISGKLGEKVGRKPLLIFALILFTISYIIAAFSPNMIVYLITRAVGGLAWGLWMSNSFVLFCDIFGQDEGPKYAGFSQTTSTVAMIIGAPIAGVICSVNWRIELYVTIPILILITILCAIGIPRSTRNAEQQPMDVKGAVFCALFLIPFCLAMSFGSSYGWTSTFVIALAAVAVVGLIGLILSEKKAIDPIMPMYLLKTKGYLSVFMASLFFSIACAVGSFLPSYLQANCGVSSTASGFVGTPGTLICIVLTSVLGVKAAKTGRYKGMVMWWLLLTALTSVLFLLVGKPIVAGIAPFLFILIANLPLSAANSMQSIVPYTYYMKVLDAKDLAAGGAFMIFPSIFGTAISNGVLGALTNSSMGLAGIFILPIICCIPMAVFCFMFQDVKAKENV